MTDNSNNNIKCAGTFAELCGNLGVSYAELASAMRNNGRPSRPVSRREEDASDARRARALRQANAARMAAFVKTKI